MTCSKGQGGRKSKTLREKQIIGVKHKSRLNDNPPDVIKDRIEKFEHLGEVGQKMFEFYEPMLFNNGTLSATDAIPLFMLCKKYEDWYFLIDKIEKDGRFSKTFKRVTDEDGKTYTVTDIKIAPWARMEKDAFNDLLKICREFGLTPVSRAGVDKIKRGGNLNPIGCLT